MEVVSKPHRSDTGLINTPSLISQMIVEPIVYQEVEKKRASFLNVLGIHLGAFTHPIYLFIFPH